jgi:hypothetical protein
MSPGEGVREKTLELLAGPEGLNAAFLYHCQKRQIAPPVVGDGDPSQPFDFTPNSNNVLRLRESIDWLNRNSNQQYPCLMIAAGAAKQDRAGRPLGAAFSGSVTCDLLFYLAWYAEDEHGTTDFEAPLDALEEALFAVLNQDPAGWVPLRYQNLLDVVDRLPLESCNEDTCLRRGLRLTLTAGVTL